MQGWKKRQKMRKRTKRRRKRPRLTKQHPCQQLRAQQMWRKGWVVMMRRRRWKRTKIRGEVTGQSRECLTGSGADWLVALPEQLRPPPPQTQRGHPSRRRCERHSAAEFASVSGPARRLAPSWTTGWQNHSSDGTHAAQNKKHQQKHEVVLRTRLKQQQNLEEQARRKLLDD